jgi:hypothetical protein
MGQSLDADGKPETAHHTRQREAMLVAGKMFADERARNAAAIDLLSRWLHESRHGRQFAGLAQETETLLVAAYNNARKGQGVNG